MKISIVVLVVSALFGVGCVETVSSCDADVTVEPSPLLFQDGGAGGEGGIGGQGSGLIGDGGPCDLDSECEHGKCIPSANSFTVGYCFSLAMDGCIVVTAPSPVFAMCSSPIKNLYVCGDSFDVSTLGNDCVDVATGDVGEHYNCCTKP